jgi:hypothetical protein
MGVPQAFLNFRAPDLSGWEGGAFGQWNQQRWLGLFEQVFRFDKWSPCRSYENDGPAKRDRLNSFFYLDP